MKRSTMIVVVGFLAIALTAAASLFLWTLTRTRSNSAEQTDRQETFEEEPDIRTPDARVVQLFDALMNRNPTPKELAHYASMDEDEISKAIIRDFQLKKSGSKKRKNKEQPEEQEESEKTSRSNQRQAQYDDDDGDQEVGTPKDSIQNQVRALSGSRVKKEVIQSRDVIEEPYDLETSAPRVVQEGHRSSKVELDKTGDDVDAFALDYAPAAFTSMHMTPSNDLFRPNNTHVAKVRKEALRRLGNMADDLTFLINLVAS